MKLKLVILSIFLTGCFAGNSKVTTTPIKAEVANPSPQTWKGKDLSKFTKDDLIIVEIEGPAPHDFAASGEKQIWVDKATPAPFDGILLNPEAMAYIITEYEALGARAQSALDNQVEYDIIKLNLETGKDYVAHRAYVETNEIISRGKDEEIKRQKDINKKIIEEAKNPWKKILICAGALVVGVGIGSGITVIAK